MKHDRKNEIMAQVKAFPSMPGAAAKLLKMLDNPDVSPSEVESVLRLDPGLTANVLKMTNSPYYGMPSKVGSVKQAIVLLGWKKIVQIVIASCAGAMQDKPVPGYDLPAGELWRHSIAVSVAAEGLAKELRLPGGDEIFTAALLHDLGKLVMGNFVSEQLETIEAEAKEGIPFTEAEKKVLGLDHTEIGAQILQSWSFPEEIIQAVRWHHQPDGSTAGTRLIDIVHVANVLCLMIGIGAGRDGLQHQISPHASQRLGIKTAHVELTASRTLQWVSELCDAFN